MNEETTGKCLQMKYSGQPSHSEDRKTLEVITST
jgi:hypothetical protein